MTEAKPRHLSRAPAITYGDFGSDFRVTDSGSMVSIFPIWVAEANKSQN